MGDTCVRFRAIFGVLILAAMGGGVFGGCAAEPVVSGRTVFLPVHYDEAMAEVKEEPPRGTLGLKHCPGQAFESTAYGPWNSAERKLMARDNAPRHQANDVVARVGGPILLQARAAYGEEDVSLEGEWVRVYLGRCDGWQQVGYQRTGKDGAVSVTLKNSVAPGVYEVAFQVAGDLSFVTAKLWVVPANTPVVVFNIAGTLLVQSDDAARALPGAVELTRAYAEHGYLVAYIAGNIGEREARKWLDEQGFSVGVVMANNGASYHRLWLGQSSQYDVVRDPKGFRSSVAEDFRVDALNAIREAGLLIDAAYGNASTDAQAFGRAGLGSEQIWLTENESWEGHTDRIIIRDVGRRP